MTGSSGDPDSPTMSRHPVVRPDFRRASRMTALCFSRRRHCGCCVPGAMQRVTLLRRTGTVTYTALVTARLGNAPLRAASGAQGRFSDSVVKQPLRFARVHSRTHHRSRTRCEAILHHRTPAKRGMERRKAQRCWFASSAKGSASPRGAPFAAICVRRTVLPGQDGRFRLRSGRLSPAFILSASSH